MADQDRKRDERIPSDLVRQDESFADLVQNFVTGLDGRTADMEKALMNGDFQMLKRLAHQLKGSGGGYGYPALTHLAAEVELQALFETLPECQRALDELKDLISRVVVRLD
ncbi:MAG: Hpt domain-containing protein [Planctomycetota bacterium]